MATVYITNNPAPSKRTGWRPDLTSAIQYGQIKFVFEAEDPVSKRPVQAMEQAIELLKDFDPYEDYLCWASSADPISVYIVTMVLTGHYHHKDIQTLIWDRGGPDKKVGCYIPVTLRLPGEPND